VDRTLSDASDRRLTTLERDRVQTATAHQAPTVSRLRSSPGIGTLLARVRRSE
jgi:hypothetical protein